MSEAKQINQKISDNKISSIKKFLNTYKHDFIEVTMEAGKNRLSKRMQLNNETFFLSVKNNKISEKLEGITRRFLYQNVKDNGQYIWINKVLDYNGGDNYAKRIIHPNLKATEGIYLSTSMKDIQGNFPYLDELHGINKNQEVFFEYFFKRLITNDISKKLSFAKLYTHENWIIATGIPLGNLNKDIENRSELIKEKYNDYIIRLIIIGVCVVLLCILLFRFMYTKIITVFDVNKRLRKKLKKELLASQNKVNKYFNLSINLNVIADFNGVIYELNDGFSNTLGYQKSELLNKSFFELIHPLDLEKSILEIKKILKGEYVSYFVTRYQHKNGTYRYLAWSANADAKKEFIYASAQDITDSKTKDTLLNQQSKMAAMGEMIGNIAHQWKQPLSAITSIASSVQVKYENNILDDKEIPSSMEHIENSAKYLAHTIDDFRNFFKETKHENITTVKKVVEKTMKLTSTLYRENQIEIIQDIDQIEFSILENELIQVIINLLNNAKDAFVIENTKRLIFIKARHLNESISIEVKDNAGGIASDVIEKVFDAYFTTKDEDKGTGIGLYMSYEIITKHLKGEISVENDIFEHDNIAYKGASFKITLPYKKVSV